MTQWARLNPYTPGLPNPYYAKPMRSRELPSSAEVHSMQRHVSAAMAGLALAALPTAVRAQAPQQPQQTPPPLEVGAVAPDFVLPGATRYGVLKNPVRLSDFKGKTVVLAFFFRARTRG